MNPKIIIEKVLERNVKYNNSSISLQKEIEDIIKEVSELTGISTKLIRFAFISQFRFVRDTVLICKKPNDKDFNIEDYKSIRLPYLGKFEPKNSFKKKYKK